MTSIWSNLAGTPGDEALEYWNYFGLQLVERAAISPGAEVLDVGYGNVTMLLKTGDRVRGDGGAGTVELKGSRLIMHVTEWRNENVLPEGSSS